MLRDLFMLMRPVNCLMTGVSVILAYIVFGGRGSLPVYLAGFATGLLVCAASMYINDVVDAEVDRINKPWKPIPSGRMSPVLVKRLSIIYVLAALAINMFIGYYAAVVVAAYAAVSYLYSFLRRYWWSHLLVSTSTTAPFIYGYALAGFPGDRLLFATLFSAVVFVINTGREIAKSVGDVEGDRAAGYSTAALRFGVESAAQAPLVLGIIGGVLAEYLFIVGEAGLLYALLLGVADAVYLYYAYMLARSPTREMSERAKNGMIKAMMLALLGFALSGL